MSIESLEPYFGELNEPQLRYLVSAASYESFPPGTVLARQGDAGDRAFIILEGEVETIFSRGGTEKTLGIRGGGSIVGEMALLEDQPRAATLRTRTLVNAFVLERDSFYALLAQQPELGLAINRTLSARMRATQECLISEMMTEIERLTGLLAERDRQLEQLRQA